MASPRANIGSLGAAAVVLLALVALQWGVFVPRANQASGNAYGLHTFDFHAYFLPRYLYGNQELAASPAETPDAARDRLFAPDFDPRTEVILESRPARGYPGPQGAPPATLARVAAPSPTRLEVEVELPRPGILVVSESYYPGWRAWVDGEAAKILCVDYLLRGVELTAGAHHVRFEYRPWSVRIGAALSLAGVVLALGLVWSDRWMRSSRSTPGRTA